MGVTGGGSPEVGTWRNSTEIRKMLSFGFLFLFSHQLHSEGKSKRCVEAELVRTTRQLQKHSETTQKPNSHMSKCKNM